MDKRGIAVKEAEQAKETDAEKLRRYVLALQPISMADVGRAIGWKYRVTYNHCHSQILNKIIAQDEQGLLTVIRNIPPRVRYATREEAVAAKNARRQKQRDAERLERETKRRAEEQAKRRSEDRQPVSRKATNAAIAQHFHHKALGFPGGVSQTANGYESVESFLARGGAIQRLQPWEVSAAARLSVEYAND